VFRSRFCLTCRPPCPGKVKHPSLDKIKNATIRAKDLRLRWEFGGAAKDAAITAPANVAAAAAAHVRPDPGLHVRIAAPYARLGEHAGRWESGRTENTAYLDVVFYDGPERDFKLDELDIASVGLVLQITEKDAPLPPVRAVTENGRLLLSWRNMTLSVPLRPDTQQALRRDAAATALPVSPGKE
jgi:hypothetical protein